MNLVYFFRFFEPKILFAPIYAITDAIKVEVTNIPINSIIGI